MLPDEDKTKEQLINELVMLRQRASKLEDVMENVIDGIGVSNRQGEIIQANKALVEMHGYDSLDEVIGRPFFDFIAEEELPRVAERFREMMAKKEKTVENLEITNLKKDGSKFLAVVNVANFWDKDGILTESFVVVRNITKRKQAEEKLRESEERFRTSVETLLDGFAIFSAIRDETGRIVDFRYEYINDAGCRLNQWTREQQIGHTLLALLPAHKDNGLFDEYVGLVETGQSLVKESLVYEDTFGGGQQLNRAFDFQVVKLGDGFAVNWRDITERKQAEETLRETQNYLLKAQELAKIGNWSWKKDGDIASWSDEIYHILGYTPGEIQPTFEWLLRITHPDDREQVVKGIEESMRIGKSYSGVYRLTKKDGKEIIVESLAEVVLNQAGETTEMIGVIQDITERKQAEEREEKLQQELALSMRLAAVGELAAGVGHEINNPLTGILGFSERLLRKSTDEEINRGLERIHDEAQRMAKMVNNLRTFACRREPEKEYSDINDILLKALESRTYEPETSNVEVVTDFARSLPEIAVDLHQIQEVFLNIILNAEQAMTEAHGRGKLTIKTEKIKNHVKISFTDDGPGVLAEHLDKLFDPFFTTREEKGGTGLGLSVCHGIVTEHGGKLYAKSKPEKGATFFVELP